MLRPRIRPTFEAALRDVSARNVTARKLAVEALSQPPEDSVTEALSALATATSDGSPSVRAAACDALAAVGGEGACDILCLVLDDGVPVVRQSAAIALGAIGHSSATDALCSALRDGPPDMRFQAATSLVEIDAEAALEPVLEALGSEEDPEVLAALALCLGTIASPRGRGPLADLLDHPSDAPRFDAAYGLAQMGDERAGPVLAAFLKNPDRGWDAASGLFGLGQAAADWLAEGLDSGVPDRVRLHVAGCLLEMAPDHPRTEAAKAELLAGLERRQVLLRAIAIDELARCGGAWALDGLAQLRVRRRGRPHIEDIDRALAEIATRSSEPEEAEA